MFGIWCIHSMSSRRRDGSLKRIKRTFFSLFHNPNNVFKSKSFHHISFSSRIQELLPVIFRSVSRWDITLISSLAYNKTVQRNIRRISTEPYVEANRKLQILF